MSKLNKGICTVLSFVFVFCFLPLTVLSAEASPAVTAQSALHTEGETIVNAQGEAVILRGVNLGGWLIQEDWFCPADNGEQGDHWTLETLIGRFGTEKAYELYNIYWDHWITEYDFEQIAAMGFNCVRIPFWYRNFQSDDNGTWIRNEAGEIDFSRLDRALEMCRKYGLYAIPDLHGVNGCQGMQDHCGQKNNCRFFDIGAKGRAYRAQALELWTLIAERYAGDPVIAMFDLINEPLCDVNRLIRNYTLVNSFYNDAYHAIREKDPTRMICMMGTWDLGKLPNPAKKGWTNVVYQLHLYNGTQQSVINRIEASKALGYNVPIFAGEFHPTGDNTTLTVSEILTVYETYGVHWAVWTWKGYNSWAAWADWFIYGSVSDELTVHPETDSYEEIAAKWGAMATNGGSFYSGHLDEEVLPFLPDGKPASGEPEEEAGALKAFFRELARKIRILFELIIDVFT